jgi:hypothetical protein
MQSVSLIKALYYVLRAMSSVFRPDFGFRAGFFHLAWSLDLFRVESILLKAHWISVVMDQFTRRIIGFVVQAGAGWSSGLAAW